MAAPLTWMTWGCTLVLLATECLSTHLLARWARTITALQWREGEEEEGRREEGGGGGREREGQSKQRTV